MRGSVRSCAVCSAGNPVASKSREPDFYATAERRIGRLTLILGLGAAALVVLLVSGRAGVGVGVGAALAWLNYVWLRQAAQALTQLAATPGRVARPRISVWVYIRCFGRYVLIAFVAYVIVTRFGVPVASLLSGLLALGAAAMAEGIYEILHQDK